MQLVEEEYSERVLVKRYDKKLEEDAWVPSELLEAAKDGDLERCAHPLCIH